MNKNKENNKYELAIKKMCCARHYEDADALCRAREELASQTSTLRGRWSQFLACREIKKSIIAANKAGAIEELFERWAKEIEVTTN